MSATIAQAFMPLIAALLTAAIALRLGTRQHKHFLIGRIADEYVAIRKAIVSVVAELSDLRHSDDLSAERRLEFRDRVSRAFYEHYDLVPRDIRNALILLHASLQYPAQGPFCVNADNIETLPEADYVAFVAGCNDFTNIRMASLMALKSRNERARSNEVVRLHARNVLRAMTASSSLFQLLTIAERVEVGFHRGQRRRSRITAVCAIRQNLLLVLLTILAVVAVAMFVATFDIPAFPWIAKATRFAITLLTIIIAATVIDKVRANSAPPQE